MEILIALAILSIVLLAFHRLQAMTIRLNQEAEFLSLAPLLARERLNAHLRSTDAVAGDEAGDWQQRFPGWRWEIRMSRLETELGWPPDLAAIRYDVAVYSPRRSEPFQLRTYRWVDDL